MDRRQFLSRTGGALGALSAGVIAGCVPNDQAAPDGQPLAAPPPGPQRPYTGPNVILIRFGGGVRRKETIAFPEKTFCPFLYHELFEKHGLLFSRVEISGSYGVVTSHNHGTLYLLTGRYDPYEELSGQEKEQGFLPKAPTLFESLQQQFQVPDHQALLVNGEDPAHEGLYSWGRHHLYGIRYRNQVLNPLQIQLRLLRGSLKNPNLSPEEREKGEKFLHELEFRNHRGEEKPPDPPELEEFWSRWLRHYGPSGLNQPRGDRLVTVLALRALRELRPKFLMIQYQDVDYVHGGNASHYTQAIAAMDEGLGEIHTAVQADEAYRENTVFLVVPDCGRDNNRCRAVPFQHHWGGRSSREIFVVLAGPARLVPRRPKPIDSPQEQISVAATVGEIMEFPTRRWSAPSLLRAV